MKSFCKDCMWAQTKEDYPYCIDLQNSAATECSRRYVLDEVKEDDSICPNCDRDKDPGKCWWCCE